jgi:hypothetical protein
MAQEEVASAQLPPPEQPEVDLEAAAARLQPPQQDQVWDQQQDQVWDQYLAAVRSTGSRGRGPRCHCAPESLKTVAKQLAKLFVVLMIVGLWTAFVTSVVNKIDSKATIFLLPASLLPTYMLLAYLFVRMLDSVGRDERGLTGQWMQEVIQRASRERLSTIKWSVPASKLATSPASATEQPHRCAVCIEDLEQGQLCRRLPCSHAFHKDCNRVATSAPGLKRDRS